jgi:hypothetical protein
MLQAKTKSKVCIHALPRAAVASELTSLLREGPGAATCPWLRTRPLHLGGLWRCHMPRGSGPHLSIQEGSGAATRPLASDPTSPLWRGPALTCALRLQTAPASEVGSGADTCPMTLHGPWAIEIKEGLAVTVCSETRVFSRHARSLLRRLQDVRADGVIMTCKLCGHALLHRATVHRRVADRS